MSDLLFELRCEELPPRDLRDAARSLADALAAALTAAGLAPSSTSVAYTPRRIAVWAHGLAARTADREERLVGPKLRAAFDAAGAPTQAAMGFAKKAGVAVGDLQRDAELVFVVKRVAGSAAADVVASVLPELPRKVRWKKTMRWGASVEFARPIRGVVALLGGDVVACTVAGLEAGRVTRGHPFLAPGDVVLETASKDDYLVRLKKAHVIADPAERTEAVRAAARRAAPEATPRAALLDEVTNLVEWPSALLGRFDRRFLELPPKLLVTVMEHHQRFFPVRDAAGALTPSFVAILDRDEASADTARRGFERVLVPRLFDASFFMGEDRKSPLAARLPKLADMTYHRKLGTVADRAARLEALAGRTAERLGLPAADAAAAREAGRLAKCDLATLLVGEFPELQGHVGSVYARAEGVDAAVCDAIDAQYLHDFDGVTLRGPALALVLAENLDVLAQFGTKVGLPSGSTDPFGVRRAAIALVDACDRFAPTFDIAAALRDAGGDDACAAYLDTRIRQRMRDEGFRHDHLDAVAAWTSVGALRARLQDLAALAGEPSFARLREVAERCRNITKKADGAAAPVRADLLVEPAEKALFAAWQGVRATLPASLARADVSRIASSVADPLHAFFAEVFVNADDLAVRGNRLALLREIDATLLRFADLCRIQGA